MPLAVTWSRKPLGAALLLLLAGCITESRFLPSLADTTKGQLVLNLKHQTLCYSESTLCHRLDLIRTSFEKDRIARAYGLDSLSRVNDAGELSDLLANPPNAAYTASADGPQLYYLPITPETLTVWKVLESEYRERYSPTGIGRE